MISGTLLLIILFGVGSYYLLFRKKKGKLPPGPRGLPLIGNLLQLDKRIHLTFTAWSKKFGDIYTARLGGDSMIVVSDHKLVKEILSLDAFSGRPPVEVFDLYTDGVMHGVVGPEGAHWEQLRRFTLRHLRDFGFGKNSMENYIMEDVKEMLAWMKSQEGNPVGNIKERFTLAVVNSLWSIISGNRYQHDDPRLQSITTRTNSASQDAAEKGMLIFFLPWLKHVIPEWSGYNGLRKVMEDIREFIEEAVTEHKNTLQEDHSRDFIDAFLQEIKQTKDPESAFFKELGEKQLKGTVADLFMAGSDTTSTTLSWAILYLTTFPEAQEKFQKEIESVTGNSRSCTLADRPNMPYTEALIAEVLRYSSIVSIGLAHRSLMDKEFRGYLIPKNTMISANIFRIHSNPDVWGDPENFRPERFLSPDEQTFKKHEALIPFQIGKRQCLGESLARDTIFLFITNIFQKFHVEFDPSQPQPDLEPQVGFLLYPKQYKVVLKDKLV